MSLRGDLLTVYIDIIFLENLFMNYIIIFATTIILKLQTKIIRSTISSIIGSIYAIVLYTSELEIYSNFALKIILSFAMVQIAFGPNNIRQFFKSLIIFYLTSFTFGGVAFALLYFVRPQDILIQNGVLIGLYPIKMILAGGILGFIIIITAFKNIKGRITKNDMFCDLKIILNNKKIQLKAIIDTGNFLKEPITKTPVIIVQKNILKEILPDVLLNNLNNIIMGEELDLQDMASKIRIIPFSSLGKENGIIIGVKADEAIIDYQEKQILTKNVIIGIYDGILSKTNKYQGLIGLETITNEGGKNNEHFANTTF